MAAENAAKTEPTVLPHNGAAVVWLPHPHERWGVADGGGVYHGMRVSREAALALAESLPGRPAEPPAETVVNRSPEALPLPQQQWAATGIPRDERRDFDFSAPMRGEPEVRVRDGAEENRAMSRRQNARFLEVYGRHMGRRAYKR